MVAARFDLAAPIRHTSYCCRSVRIGAAQFEGILRILVHSRLSSGDASEVTEKIVPPLARSGLEAPPLDENLTRCRACFVKFDGLVAVENPVRRRAPANARRGYHLPFARTQPLIRSLREDVDPTILGSRDRNA